MQVNSGYFVSARSGRIFLLTALILLTGRAFAQTPDAISALAPQSRIVLLPPAETITDPRILDALTQMRGGKRGRSRPASSAPKRGSDKFNKLQKGLTKPPPPPPLLTEPQLQTIARVLFRETLAERLRTSGKFSVVPDEAARAMLKTLPAFRPRGEFMPSLAGVLAAKLQADAVLNIEDARLTLPNPDANKTILRVLLRLYGPRILPEPTGGIGLNALESKRFASCGSAERTVSLFGKRTARIGAMGTGRAARQAALRAAHTLRTGEILPLSSAGARFALAPVSSPSAADALLFTAGGRKVKKAAVRDLPSEVSGLFAPDLAPLPESNILPAYKMRKVLLNRGLSIASLWTHEDEPQIERARTAAREIGADYVLMATVSDLDVDTGQEMGANPAAWLTEGRAEAVGILFRVSDGAVLWRDRASAALANRAENTASFSLLRQEQAVSRDAAKFALLELQRRFHRYVTQFEN